MKRRTFLKTSTAGITSLALSNLLAMSNSTKVDVKSAYSIRKLKEPVAIAMWDFSWLRRHHPAGEFEDWDLVLDELVELGYNAIRIDCFPNLVAADINGKITEEFYFPKHSWTPVMWGNNVSVRTRPRDGLLEFLPKCRERGVHVGLSTWFFGPGQIVEGIDGFVRVWDETLSFLNDHGLVHDLYYVDLLNEYPLFHGFQWFKDRMKKLGEKSTGLVDEFDPNEAHIWRKNLRDYNESQTIFYREFMTNTIRKLSKKWPKLAFFASLPNHSTLPWQNMDFSTFDALDVHYWFCQNPLYSHDTGYWKYVHRLTKNDLNFAETSKNLRQRWNTHREELIEWLDYEMGKVATVGKQHGLPYGNTEGWGPASWLDHPDLGWDLVKEAGEVAVRLGQKHGYTFNCSSNHTHPQFGRFWKDVQWHKKITSIIRKG